MVERRSHFAVISYAFDNFLNGLTFVSILIHQVFHFVSLRFVYFNNLDGLLFLKK